MYAFNEKIKSFAGYAPVQPDDTPIHLDANESFVALPHALRATLQDRLGEIDFCRYPDPSARALTGSFADHYGVRAELVTAGNGSDELIGLLFGSFLEKGDAFAVVEPDFSMYRFYGQLVQARPVVIQKEKDYTLNPQRVIERCEAEQVKLLIFSNPCNPTSIGVNRAAVREIVAQVSALVVVDEAYMDFWDQSLLEEVEKYDNMVILRTCSKAIGMAGIRLGFAVANEKLTRVLQTLKSPYNVNVVTQEIGALVLAAPEPLARAREEIRNAMAQLRAGLQTLLQDVPQCTLLPGVTNFAAIQMPEPEAFFDFLKARGILVRLTGGLIRVTCGTREENDQFLSAMDAYFHGG